MNPERLVTLMEILRVYAHQFVQKAYNIEIFSDLIKTTDIRQHSKLDFVISELEGLIAICKDGELPMTRIPAESLLYALKNPSGGEYNSVVLTHFFSILREGFTDELSTKLSFQLPHSRKDLFEKPLDKWASIAQRFPESIRDIEEASKCFAFSRYAACVFHCVQVMEHGLIRLGSFLTIKDSISGWTSVASELKRIISKKYQDRTDFEKQHFHFIEQMQGTVEALKNKISHAHAQRLVLVNSDFTSDIADDIMNATRSFMRRLAEELPQDPTGATQ